MRPMVSVVMSVFNGRKYLAESVESILAQKYVKFEFIVIDDGSTDGANNDLKWHAARDRRIRLIGQRNLGLVDALNTGIEAARGMFIARMDADDVSHPDRLSMQLERMVAESDLVLLGTAFLYIDSKGRELKHQLLHCDDGALQQYLREYGNQFCHPSVMFRKDAILEVGGYRALIGQYAQDYDLWLRLSDAGKVANLSAPLLRYRVHEEQISVRNVFDQRRAAEIYRTLAMQRRLGEKEDLKAAIDSVDKRPRLLRGRVASDYLEWADLFGHMGDARSARKMLMRALLAAPGSVQVRRALQSRIRAHIRIAHGSRRVL